jgi:hypothetical protein
MAKKSTVKKTAARPNRGKGRAKAAAKKSSGRVREVLVILSNRLNFFQKHVFFEIKADDQGTVLKQTKLKSAAPKPIYDEVWENDEGRIDLNGCHRFAKKYGHKLLRR